MTGLSSVEVVATGLTAIVDAPPARFAASVNRAGADVTWSAEISGLLPGFCSLVAIATAGVGQTGSASPVIVLVG